VACAPSVGDRTIAKPSIDAVIEDVCMNASRKVAAPYSALLLSLRPPDPHGLRRPSLSKLIRPSRNAYKGSPAPQLLNGNTHLPAFR